MANPELGAKQICPSCATKFYDLGRRPAHCPKCQNEFDPEEAMRNRRVRARVPLPEDDAEEEKPKVAEEVEDGFEAEPDEAKELDAAIEDAPLIADDDDEAADPDAAPADAGRWPGRRLRRGRGPWRPPTTTRSPSSRTKTRTIRFPEDDIEGLGPEGADDH